MKKQFAALMITMLLAAGMMAPPEAAAEFDLQKADTHDRMTYHRAVDRFYGPEPALFGKSFELNDIELVK